MLARAQGFGGDMAAFEPSLVAQDEVNRFAHCVS